MELADLREHAEANPLRVFDINDPCDCLAASLTGGQCSGFGSLFIPGTTRDLDIDYRFALFCFTAVSGLRKKQFTGAALAGAIAKMEAGIHPDQVADETEHVPYPDEE